MTLAYTTGERAHATDVLLTSLADTLAARGLRVCGLVQCNTARGDGGRCDMDVRLFPTGETFRISEFRGVSARGCRLNADALERAAAQVEIQVSHGADLMVINKFGKHEAQGRGLRNAMAIALERDIPVITGLNPLNRAAFEHFASGLAIPLPPDLDALLSWAEHAVVAPAK